MNNAILINNLTKRYGDITAVDGLTLKVKKGELFAFLGINGAGKTTAISIICGQLARDGGEVTVLGHNIDNGFSEIKSKIGVVFQHSALDSSLSVNDNLILRGALYGMSASETEKRIDELDRLFDIKPLLRRTLSKLSGGQKRRVDIARALIHSPELLILDEPTTGLDPQTRSMVWQAIGELRAKDGLTVFLTTHYMEEAADSDYTVILDCGKIIAEGSPHELKTRYAHDTVTVYGIDESQAQKIGLPYTKLKDAYRFTVANTKIVTEQIIKNPELFEDYEIIKGTLDDVFLAATGKKLGGDNK